jgi:hypothetical protein
MSHAYFYKTCNVTITTQAGTTFTHSLGVAPADYNGGVIITMRTGTVPVYVLSSTSQLVVLGTLAGAVAVIDLEVIAYHTIQY